MDSIDQMRAEALVLSALLQSCLRSTAQWSVVLSLVAAVALASGWNSINALWLMVFVGGGVERYLALRLSLDEKLFFQIGLGQMPSLSALDRALQSLGLRNSDSIPRSWQSRVQGARRLWRIHTAVVLLQTAGVLLAILVKAFV